MRLFATTAALALAVGSVASAFTVAAPAAAPARLSLLPLFMGRAAAVRAATKSKTDAKKAKINAVYGKRIIMAVKQGGGPDPEANRMLADVIKQAKANNVPVDVSARGATEIKDEHNLTYLRPIEMSNGRNGQGS